MTFPVNARSCAFAEKRKKESIKIREKENFL